MMNEQTQLSIERWCLHRRRTLKGFQTGVVLMAVGFVAIAVACSLEPAISSVVLLGAFVLGIGMIYMFMAALHHTKVQSCPACGRNFGEAAQYQRGETPGLAIFGKVPHCPFCKIKLES